MPSAASALQRVGCGRLDRVGDGDDAGGLAVHGKEDGGRAVAAQALGFRSESGRVDVQFAEKSGIAEREPFAVDRADRRPFRLGESKSRTGESSSLRSAAAATMAAARGCSLPRSTLAASCSTCVSSKSGRRHDRHDLRLAFGERAGLVDHERVDLFHALERFGVLDQHAGLRAAADADHDRHRRREAQRARAGDDQHAHCRDQADRRSAVPGRKSPRRRRR